MNILTIVLIVVGAVLLWVVLAYNSLVRLRNAVKTAWSGIDVQLKRRADLIPNLVNTVKGYAKHEKELLEKLTKLRAEAIKQKSIDKRIKSENEITEALRSIFAVAENYPNLKASENFKKLQEELTETEDQIAAARRIYNDNVRMLNNKIETFPSNIIAKMFNFKEQPFFEAAPGERKNIKVEF